MAHFRHLRTPQHADGLLLFHRRKHQCCAGRWFVGFRGGCPAVLDRVAFVNVCVARAGDDDAEGALSFEAVDAGFDLAVGTVSVGAELEGPPLPEWFDLVRVCLG